MTKLITRRGDSDAFDADSFGCAVCASMFAVEFALTVDQDESPDQEGDVADETVSEKEALKLVHAADRELARAIEECVGREDLLAELQRARTRIAAGLREIVREAPVAAVPASGPGKRRGSPESVEETTRRAAVLERVQAGEITNAEAAAEIGISNSAWSAWKSIHAKRNGALASAPTVRASVASSPIATGKRGRGRPSDTSEATSSRRGGDFRRLGGKALLAHAG